MAKREYIFVSKDESGQMMTLASRDKKGVPSLPGYTEIVMDDDLGELKKQVRADDFSDDDDYLETLLDAAEDTLLRTCNRSIEELLEIGGGDVPRAFVHAKLMLAAHWYNQREAVSQGEMKEVPYTLSALIKPLTKLV